MHTLPKIWVVDRNVHRKPRLVGGVKGHNMNDNTLPGSHALWAGSFTWAYLYPALSRRPIHLRINSLGTADTSGKADHAGNMNPNGAIAAAAEDAISPDDSLHLFQSLPADLSPFLVKSPERLDHLIGRHVLGLFVMGRVEKAAFGTKTAMDTVGQKTFHLAFIPIQHLLDLFRFDGSLFLVWHLGFQGIPSLSSFISAYHVRVPWEKLYSLPTRNR